MKEELMKRFLDLIEKTGDKVVITDPAGERPYVLMSLDQYEKLLDVAPSKDVIPAQAGTQNTVPERTTAKKELHIKKEIPLWRTQLGRELADAPIKEFSRTVSKAKPTQATVEDYRLEAEGEERFYLEPLE